MVHKKKLLNSFISVIIVSVFSTSCSSFNSGLLPNPYSDAKPAGSRNVVMHKSSRIGKNVFRFALGGALLGAAVGAITGKNDKLGQNMIKGGMIGGVAGAIAGYVYGRVDARLMASRDSAVQRYNYSSAKGTLVHIENIEVDPGAIAKGNPLSFRTTYTVLTPSEKDDVNVQMGFGVVLSALDENNDMYNPGQLQEFQLKNGGGTFQVTVPLTQTSQYEPQSYKFIVGIETDGTGKRIYATKSVKFNVLSARHDSEPLKIALSDDGTVDIHLMN